MTSRGDSIAESGRHKGGRPVLGFLALAFGISWSLAALAFDARLGAPAPLRSAADLLLGLAIGLVAGCGPRRLTRRSARA